MAGYSKKSLVQKLGLKAGYRVVFLNAPSNYKQTLGELPESYHVVDHLATPLDFIQFFTKERTELESQFANLKQVLDPAGMLWICWPKRASKITTDLDENIVREIGLAHGLVDVKVCAVDEVWSGLKFVYRLQDRK